MTNFCIVYLKQLRKLNKVHSFSHSPPVLAEINCARVELGRACRQVFRQRLKAFRFLANAKKLIPRTDSLTADRSYNLSLGNGAFFPPLPFVL